MSLFWKIFVWFWSAMVVMGAALWGVVTATRPDPLPTAWRQATSQSLAIYAAQSAEAFEAGGATALSLSLRHLRNRGRNRLWLFDQAAHSVAGDPQKEADADDDAQSFGAPPDGMQQFDSFGRPDGMGPGHGPMPSHVAERLPILVQSALDANDGQERFDPLGRTILVAQSVVAPSGRRFVRAGETRSPPGGRAPLESGALLLRLGAVLGTGTLLCYGMARYLTLPVVALRAATRRLAEGDLQARSGGERNRRRDELADLSRDFDRMASRIEALMTSERRLAQAQRRLLGDVSHELRSPLTRLSVALALARHHESAPEAQKAHERIGRETQLLNDMIGQLLQLARLESELESRDLAPAKTSIELSALVPIVAANAQFEARQRGRDVRLGKIAPCRVLGHEPLLHSAIENVVRNAIRYTAQGTPVEIELRSLENSAVLTVRDHGEGVPPEALHELWRPFYRVESARDRDSGGVGLGLAITKHAIDWHGGLIVARNAPDGGLIIQIHLPLEIDIDALF